MPKFKEHPKYNVLSIRVTDEEKALIEELKQNTHKSVSMLLREAMQMYRPNLKINYNQGN